MSLYGGRGSVFGWMALTPGDAGGSDLTALSGLRWTKLGGTGATYPEGLTNRVTVAGSVYAAPAAGVPVLALTNGVALLSGGGLPRTLTNGLAWAERNRFVVSPPNPQSLALSLVPATGAVGGSFIHPVTGRRTAIKAVVLPRQGVGVGFFLGMEQAGTVVFGPAAP
jgi:hypothetical protein